MRSSRSQAHKDHKKTSCSIRMHQKSPFLMQKRPKMAFFWSKVNLLVSDKQSKLPHPNFGALDAKRQVVGTHRSRKHNVPQPYAPKCAISNQK